MNNIDLSIDLKEFFEGYGNPSEEELNLAEEISETFKQLKELHEEAYNINERLEFDDMLLSEYSTNLSVLNMIELCEDEHDDMEMVEHAYLKTIDSLIRLAKVIHPISGFGLERLESAYELIDTFQEVYHPLLTFVTADNIDSFANLLTDKEYDEVYYNRKKAIGALRLKGTNTYAAGIIVFRTETIPVINSPVIRVDHMYVHESFRSFGTANLLMAALLRPILNNRDARVTLNYMPEEITENDSDEYVKAVKKEFDMTCEFLSSWSFNFTMDFSKSYYVFIKDINDALFTSISDSGVKSLNDLGSRAEYTVNKFAKLHQDFTFEDLATTPFDYYDKDASCVYMEDNEVTSILLCHKYKDNDYILNNLRISPNADNKSVLKLIKHAYNVCKERGDMNSILSGETATEESYELIQKIAPNAKCIITYDGILSPLLPSETLNADQWETLKKEAGLSDKYSGIDEKTFSTLDDTEKDKAFEDLINFIV